MKKRSSVGLLIWGGDHYWSGWQGFAGLYKNKARALDRLYAERNRQSNKAQIVDFNTLEIITTLVKKDGAWHPIQETVGR